MLLRRLFFILIMASAFRAALAQYDPTFSHYFDLETSFNPAAAGKQPLLNISAVYALDMVGFEHNPQTAYAAADMPFYVLKRYHGVGLTLTNDKIGLFTHQRLAMQYALRSKLLGGDMAYGVQLGLINENFDGSKLDVEDSSDPAFTTSQVTGNAIDLGAGLYYSRKDFSVGLSVQHLTSPLILLGETNELKILPTYYFTSSYNIKLRNPFLTIKPSMLFRTDMHGWRGDATARLVYQNNDRILYAGLAYSPTVSATVLVGGTFHGIVIGYSYEAYTNGLKLGNGSHELSIGFRKDINLAKKGKNIHKSPRML